MKFKKLLLVDNNSSALSAFGNELSNKGYIVLLANTAEEAIRLAKIESDISLAIVDICLSDLTGIETAKVLKSHKVLSIFILSEGNDKEVKMAVKSDGLGYLIKPVNTDRSIPVIESMIKIGQEIQGLLNIKEGLDSALETGHHVNVAIGILMERHKLKREEAFELLRKKARSNRKKVKDIAIEFIEAWHSMHLIASQDLET